MTTHSYYRVDATPKHFIAGDPSSEYDVGTSLRRRRITKRAMHSKAMHSKASGGHRRSSRRAFDRLGWNRTSGRRVFDHLLRVFITLVLAIASVPLYNIFEDHGAAYASDTVEYVCGQKLSYGDGGFFTHSMTCDGVPAYCVQTSLESPKDGTYWKESLSPERSTIENLRSLLWFGWGGPGFDESMWPDTYCNKRPMTNTDLYVLTHIVLSFYYYDEFAVAAFNGLSSTEREWMNECIMPTWDTGSGFTNGVSNTFADMCFQRSGEVPASFECFAMNSHSIKQTVIGFVATGSLSIEKRSDNLNISSGNPLYSFEGIIYDIYSDQRCKNLLASFVLDASGRSNQIDITSGTYYVRERQDSCLEKGYAVDTSVHVVVVGSGNPTILTLSDEPQYAKPDMWVKKQDGETTSGAAIGATSLAGGEFTIRYYPGLYSSVKEAEATGSPARKWIVKTDENGIASFGRESLVAGDSLFFNMSGEVVAPLGTYLIQETKPPIGYLLDDKEVFIRTIYSSGTSVTVGSYNIPIKENLAKRGDLEFIKVAEGSMARLANIPFRLTSETTGESHIVVTDSNGRFDSSSTPHSVNTNANDNVTDESYSEESGTWFGQDMNGCGSDPVDSRGALPFDTYSLEELPCAGNKDFSLISIGGISVKKEHELVSLGTIVDPMNQTQYINTTAYDGNDLDKSICLSESTYIIDSIEYMNLVPGNEYTLVTELVYADSGDVITVDGTPLTSERTFYAEGTNGKTSVDMRFDSTSLDYENVVFYESLYSGDILLAKDADRNNSDQMLRVVPPVITTNAWDLLDGDKTISCDGNACIVDTISYTNLAPNTEYYMSGSLMLVSKDGQGNPVVENALERNGEPITASKSFTPIGSDGSIEVTFHVAQDDYPEGSKLVVFERLYENDELIAEHCDADDENQSMYYAKPIITTQARDSKSSSDIATVEDLMEIEDTVAIQNLSIGAEYELIGVLVNIDSGLKMPTDIDHGYLSSLDENEDRVIISKKSFIPTESNVNEVVSFSFDGSELMDDADAGSVVILEYLFREDELVAVHDEMGNTQQMVSLIKSSISTKACDGTDNDQIVSPGQSRTIIDTISYDNLVVGEEYVVHGCLMDKETEDYIFNGDDVVEGATRFTPTESTGEVNVEFSLDTSHLDGKELVAFEYLYKDDVLVADHTDIADAAQMITVKSIEGGLLARTGDAFDFAKSCTPYLALLTALSCFAINFMIKARRKTRQISSRSRLIHSVLANIDA